MLKLESLPYVRASRRDQHYPFSLGVEATGYLLYWLSSWFIVCSSKTGFCYHFYSTLLHEMLRRLGLREGILLNYLNEWQHQEAQRIAWEYIEEHYGSLPNSRRLHYYLKEKGYLQYDEDVYTLKVYHYANGKIGLDRGKELLHQDGIRANVPLVDVEIKSSFPFEHVYEPNEET